MAVGGVSAASSHASSQQASSLAPHHHGGRHPHSFGDVDAQGSSVASAPSSTGKIGSKVNITA